MSTQEKWTKDYKARQAKRGMKLVQVWVPEKDRARLLKYADKLRRAHHRMEAPDVIE